MIKRSSYFLFDVLGWPNRPQKPWILITIKAVFFVSALALRNGVQHRIFSASSKSGFVTGGIVLENKFCFGK